MDGIGSPSRRALFGLRSATPVPAPFRPPWAKFEPDFLAACTRCQACVLSCPEQVLIRDTDGLPQFDPRLGECTFCGDCAAACESNAFEPERQRPWTLVSRVAESCLSAQGVVCASCREVCPTMAIRVLPGARAAAAVNIDACTGCGACIGTCPVDALSLHHSTAMEAVI